MNIEHQISTFPRFSQHIGLERISSLLDELNLRRAPFPYIHIAGTKGKGSTAVFLTNILEQAGYKTGLFTSPHLSSINERICVNLQPISLSDLESHYLQIHDVLQRLKMFDISYFELMTAIALFHFSKVEADIVILETGMGGRLDATNALINPFLTILTTIGLDHVERLGYSISAIAREKAAIIKPSAPVLSAPQPAEAEVIIQEKAKWEGVRHYSVYRDYEVSTYPANLFEKERFDVLSYITGLPYPLLELSLLGKHQAVNASLALASAELLAKKGIIIKESHIRKGLRQASWPGRFETIKLNGKMILMDGAHNPESTLALANTLKERFSGYKIQMLYLSLANKLVHQNLHNLATIANQMYFTSIKGHAVIEPEDMKSWMKTNYPEIPCIAEPDEWKCFISAMEAISSENEILCITGSLYYIGWLRSKLNLPFYLEDGRELMEVYHD